MKKPPNHLIHACTLSDDRLIRAARQFGAPVYVYDAHGIERQWTLLNAGLPDGVDLFYSVKANPSLAVIQKFEKLGADFEVASIGELATVRRVGVHPSRVIFVGPGKTESELRHAVAEGLYALVVESRREVREVERLAEGRAERVRVVLRINPGPGKGALSTGALRQFGMEPEEALGILLSASGLANVEVLGIHGYLGGQILDWKVILEQTRLILKTAEDLQRASGRVFKFVGLGGGFGIPFHDGDQELDLSSLRPALAEEISDYRLKYPGTERITVESGRFLVGPSGIFVATVVDVKRIYHRNFVILDGGINVFRGYDRTGGLKPTPVRVLDRSGRAPVSLTLCGPLCTASDRLSVEVMLPMPEVGDLVAYYMAGAYGYSSSPGLLLSHGFPCEVMIDGEEVVLIRRRYTPEDLLSGQIIPDGARPRTE